MGWDYYTYMSQPVVFVDAVRTFLVKEQKAKLKAYKDAQRK